MKIQRKNIEVKGDSFEKSETCMDPNAKWVEVGYEISILKYLQ